MPALPPATLENGPAAAKPPDDSGGGTPPGAFWKALRGILPGEALVTEPQSLQAYASDGLTARSQAPMAAALPADAGQVAALARLCAEHSVPLVPRGAGTSLSGGALPQRDGLLLSLARMSRIIEVDPDELWVRCQPGVTNLQIGQAVAPHGLFYAPDPSSQIACTIGGNVAENAGGLHCLKYGLTTHHVLEVEVVTAEGERLRVGSASGEQGGYDLLAGLCGSEGMLGILTEVRVRVLPKPQAARALLAGFADLASAGRCVSQVIGAGMIPAGMEMMDRLAMDAVEDFCQPGYPRDCQALLIAELDGPAAQLEAQLRRFEEIARECGATSLAVAGSEAERQAFWSGRKAAFAAVGRISPDYYCMDGSIPRNKMPQVLEGIARLSREHGLAVANVFHAGDGNLHPLILYDREQDGQLERAEALGAEILRLCVAAGGALTGEHGVGVEKKGLMDEVFDEASLNAQQRLKCAYDPEGILNPGKVFPRLHRCAELGAVHVHGGQVLRPDIPRF